MLDKPYLWHPIFVHFSVALLVVAAIFYVLSSLLPRANARGRWLVVAEWNLWVGFALSLLTLLFGWIAFNTVGHDDASHPLMITHAWFALATGAAFAALTAWSAWQRRKQNYPSPLFVALAAIGVGLLLTTAWRGGDLVYD